MTRTEAERLAAEEATATQQPVDIWEHVGGQLPSGRRVMPQGRFLPRASEKDAPRYVWKKVGTVQPA